jgi:hypothetical protein
LQVQLQPQLPPKQPLHQPPPPHLPLPQPPYPAIGCLRLMVLQETFTTTTRRPGRRHGHARQCPRYSNTTPSLFYLPTLAFLPLTHPPSTTRFAV